MADLISSLINKRRQKKEGSSPLQA